MPFQKLRAGVPVSPLSLEAQGWVQLSCVRDVFLWKAKAEIGRAPPLLPHAFLFLFLFKG